MWVGVLLMEMMSIKLERVRVSGCSGTVRIDWCRSGNSWLCQWTTVQLWASCFFFRCLSFPFGKVLWYLDKENGIEEPWLPVEIQVAWGSSGEYPRHMAVVDELGYANTLPLCVPIASYWSLPIQTSHIVVVSCFLCVWIELSVKPVFHCAECVKPFRIPWGEWCFWRWQIITAFLPMMWEDDCYTFVWYGGDQLEKCITWNNPDNLRGKTF